MKSVHPIPWAIVFWLPALLSPAAEVADKPSFEQYLRGSAVTRDVIDAFLRGPSWAQYDPELGYILWNYLPSDGMDRSATISTVQSNGARTSFVYAGRKCRINTYGGCSYDMMLRRLGYEAILRDAFPEVLPTTRS
jgi:hypothetical protein